MRPALPGHIHDPTLLDEATRIVEQLIRECVKLGMPVYARYQAPGLIHVETRHGKDVYMVFILYDPFEDRIPVALGKPTDYVTIAAIDPESRTIIDKRLDAIPYALATNPDIMPNYEADAWSIRLRVYPSLKPCGKEWENPPGTLHCSDADPCNAAVVDSHGVAAWLDTCTGEVTDARYWQRRLHLRP